MTIVAWDQIGIAVFGSAAIWLTSDPNPRWARWASVCGLLSQPFWFYTTYENAQWGAFWLNFLYAFAWGRGFRQYWIKGRGITG